MIWKSRVVAMLAAAVLLSACGGTTITPVPTAAQSGPSTPNPSAPQSGEPTLVPSPSSAATPRSRPSIASFNVRVALDWTPNTDHTGLYVASAKGWYADAGIHVQLLPYNQTAPETLMSAGQAECGISFHDSLTFATAAGADVRSVMAILQHTASAIAVLGDSPIKRPRDLDGKTYGGFGYPADHPTIAAVIKKDGGKGDFKEATLNTSAYEALYSKAVDFTIVFTAWEGVEAKGRGIDLRYFKATDYGFPDSYQVVLACNTAFLRNRPDVARSFLDATVRGFQFAADNPAEGAALLVAANKGIFDANPKLPADSAAFIADHKLYLNEAGLVGPQTLDRWTAYSAFLYEQGLLVDGKGKPLTAPPDYQQLFTNEFLPGGV